MDDHNKQGQSPDEWTKPGAKSQNNAKKILIKPIAPKPTDSTPAPGVDAVASGGNGGNAGNSSSQANNSQQPAGRSNDPKALSIFGIGIGDRMHHLAMSHSTPNMPHRQSHLVRTKAPEKVRATSKAECARSRGANKFCDPSHPASCGGKFCGRPLNARRSDDFI